MSVWHSVVIGMLGFEIIWNTAAVISGKSDRMVSVIFQGFLAWAIWMGGFWS